MRNKSKSEAVKRPVFNTPIKGSQVPRPLETQAYKSVWFFFYLFMMACVIWGIFARIFYAGTHGEYPDRKKVGTFTQFRFINKYMLLWPALYAFCSYFTTTKDENGKDISGNYRKSLRLNVIVQVFLIYVFYYSIYYTSELMKQVVEAEVMSGHIYTGLLASSSIVSTTIFIHHFRDRNGQVHKIFQLICFLHVFHMGYSFFWTSFIYHNVIDTYLALVIGGFLSFFLQCCDGLWYFEFFEHTITYAARFMVSRLKESIVELVEILFTLSPEMRNEVVNPRDDDIYE